MRNKRLGCLTLNALVAFAISLIVVAVVFVVNGQAMFSPGELSERVGTEALGDVASHIDIGNQCSECHSVPFTSVGMTELCIDCHVAVISDFGNEENVHGVLEYDFVEIKCFYCHTDHQGKDGKTTYFPDGVSVNHAQTGFYLNAHNEADLLCADCHIDRFSDFKMAICSDCHKDILEVEMTDHIRLFDTNCLACHDGVETFGKAFDHNQVVFLLLDSHAILECESCHVDAKTIKDLQNTAQECQDCHGDEDVHQGTMGIECGECHAPTLWSDVDFDHSATGWVLEGGHQDLECASCHADPTYLGSSTDCVSCHQEDDTHNGRYGQECDICHVVEAWSIVSFDHANPLAENCTSCHFVDAPVPHYNGQCSACHRVEGWLPASFDHAVAGAFDCVSCHAAQLPANHFGGQCSACHITAAWLPAYFDHSFAGATDCVACHSNVKPANHFTGQCSQCHSTDAWKPASFSHTFPLDHEDANSDCALCHPGGDYQVYTCYGCHEHTPENIAEEHDEEGISNYSNCMECHADGKEPDD